MDALSTILEKLWNKKPGSFAFGEISPYGKINQKRHFSSEKIAKTGFSVLFYEKNLYNFSGENVSFHW